MTEKKINSRASKNH